MNSCKQSRSFRILLTLLLLSICVPVVKASFQFTAISRIIEGINGDASAPAIELRLRPRQQDWLGFPKLTAVDPTGSTPIALVAFGSGVAQSDTASGLSSKNAVGHALTPATATFTSNAGASFVSAAASAAPARLLNISTRARVQTGDDVLIGGFIITGGGTKRVVLRGIGPSLAAAGVPGVLADPVLELHKPDGKVVTNDDWPTARADVQTTGIPPSNIKESAIVADLVAGNYTLILRGKNNTSGIGLVEVYDLDTTAATELTNISSRGLVGSGNNVLIGGIIVGPSGSPGSRMLVRAIGPSLARFGINNPLLDPTLELHNKDGVLVASNDNWKDTQQATIQATQAPPSDTRESALVFTAAPGNYTAIVRGRNDGTGVSLVEVYNLH